MNAIRKIIFSFPFLLCLTARAQQDSVFHYLKTIPGSFSSFAVDNLNNIYLLTNTNQLKKMNLNGDSIGVYNEVRSYGELFSIDATNPLKTLLYYKDFTTIIELDRQLGILNKIDLRMQNIFNVQAITTSYDNRIWLYDEGDRKLKKADDNGNVLSETVDFSTLFDSVPMPVKIIDKDGFVYLYDPDKGFYIFDYYGTLKNKLPFLQWKSVEVMGQTLFGFDDTTVYEYQLHSLDLKQYTLPSSFAGTRQLKVINGKIFLLQKEGVLVYEVK